MGGSTGVLDGMTGPRLAALDQMVAVDTQEARGMLQEVFELVQGHPTQGSPSSSWLLWVHGIRLGAGNSRRHNPGFFRQRASRSCQFCETV